MPVTIKMERIKKIIKLFKGSEAPFFIEMMIIMALSIFGMIMLLDSILRGHVIFFDITLENADRELVLILTFGVFLAHLWVKRGEWKDKRSVNTYIFDFCVSFVVVMLFLSLFLPPFNQGAENFKKFIDFFVVAQALLIFSISVIFLIVLIIVAMLIKFILAIFGISNLRNYLGTFILLICVLVAFSVIYPLTDWVLIPDIIPGVSEVIINNNLQLFFYLLLSGGPLFIGLKYLFEVDNSK